MRHYGLDVGLLQPGDPADFIELAYLNVFRVLRTFVIVNIGWFFDRCATAGDASAASTIINWTSHRMARSFTKKS